MCSYNANYSKKVYYENDQIHYIYILLVFNSINQINAQWIKQNSGTNLKLTGVTMLDSLQAIVVGASGTILKTTDAGKNWIRLNPGFTNNLKAITFIDQYFGIVVGDSVFAKTTDGGYSWTIKKLPYKFTSCIYGPNLPFMAGDENGRIFLFNFQGEVYDSLQFKNERIAAIGVDYNTPCLSCENLIAVSSYHTFQLPAASDNWIISENPVNFYDNVTSGYLNEFPKYMVGSTGHLAVQPVYWKKELPDTIWQKPDTVWTRYENPVPLFVPFLGVYSNYFFVRDLRRWRDNYQII